MPYLPPIQGLTSPAPPVNAQVEVNLGVVFGPPAGGHHPGGIVCAGAATGMLRRWERAADGRWLGVVDIRLDRPDDVRGSYLWVGALIPADAMTYLGTT